ncbi:MAG TPA: hypothetical protein VLD57_01010 [Blastocatellia bacterium]|nr:hypothetical protein [Blastocatellia bacterium]
MRGSRLLFTASWVLLMLLSVFIVLLSLNSLYIAYFAPTDNITPTYTLDQLRAIGGEQGEEVVKALRGRRSTAATWALGYGLLAAWVVMFPYRRGERWSWWALLISLGLAQLLALARVVALGTQSGAGAAGTVLAFLLLGLLAGAPHMFRRTSMDEL